MGFSALFDPYIFAIKLVAIAVLAGIAGFYYVKAGHLETKVVEAQAQVKQAQEQRDTAVALADQQSASIAQLKRFADAQNDRVREANAQAMALAILKHKPLPPIPAAPSGSNGCAEALAWARSDAVRAEIIKGWNQ